MLYFKSRTKRSRYQKAHRLDIKSGLWALLYFQVMRFKFWSSNTPPAPKPLSTDCSAVKSARCLGTGFDRHELSLFESQLPAKASKRQSNPYSSHNRRFYLAVSAGESVPDNPRPLPVDLQSAVGTTTRKMG